jgi:hypothetical protein
VSVQRYLDRVQTYAKVADLRIDPGEYAACVAEELPPAAETLADLEARDAAFANALAGLDEMFQRVMRLELDRALADDTSIAAPTRKVFATTIIGYAGNLGLLQGRAQDVAARGRAADPAGVARLVVEAATRTLTLRDEIRQPVFDLVRTTAQAAVAHATKRATDRTLDDTWRTKWSAARRELEALAADPARLETGPWTARIAAHPEQIDEPPPEKEVTFADMIEMD